MGHFAGSCDRESSRAAKLVLTHSHAMNMNTHTHTHTQHTHAHTHHHTHTSAQHTLSRARAHKHENAQHDTRAHTQHTHTCTRVTDAYVDVVRGWHKAVNHWLHRYIYPNAKFDALRDLYVPVVKHLAEQGL